MSDAKDGAAPNALADVMRGEGESGLMSGIPFAGALGMRLIDTGDGRARLALPYREDLVGDPGAGVIHGGAVTALLDTCAGVAVMQSGDAPKITATLDLRIDYMRPATPGQTLYADAECYRETRVITFMKAVAYHDDPGDPVAAAIGAFMVERQE